MVNKRVKKIVKRQKDKGHYQDCNCETCFLLSVIREDSGIIGGNRRTIKKLRRQVKESGYAHKGALKDVSFNHFDT